MIMSDWTAVILKRRLVVQRDEIYKNSDGVRRA